MGKLIKKRRKSLYSPILPKMATCSVNNNILRKRSRYEYCSNDGNISPKKIDDGPSTVSQSDFKLAIVKLSSNYSEDRLSAIDFLLALPMNKKNVKKFQDSNCIAHVVPLMSDPYTQLQATSLISKLIHSESTSLNESIVYCILASLCPLIKLFKVEDLCLGSKEIAKENAAHSHAIEKSKVFIASVEILTKLCELNQGVVAKVSEEGLIPILFQFINPGQFGYVISLTTLQCLLCVTEMNNSVCLPTDQLLHLISHQPQDYHQVYYSVLVAGILVNIATSEVHLVNPVFEIISQTIDIDILTACNDVTVGSNSEVIAQADGLLSAQKRALEIVTDICYIDDEGSDDEKEDPDSDMSSFMDRIEPFEDDLSVVRKALQEFKTVEKVLVKATLSIDNLTNDGATQKQMLHKINGIKQRAVMCLINMSGFLNSSDVAVSEVLHNIFSHLGDTILAEKGKDDPLLEDLSVAMRTVVENMCAGKCKQLYNVSADELMAILTIAVKPKLQIPLTHVVGSLCCFLIENLPENEFHEGKPLECLAAVTNHLLKMAAESSELWVCAEALDIIIDVFSNDKTDWLAAQLKLLPALRDIKKLLFCQFKKQRKKLGLYWPLIETVCDNLPLFIEHKSKRLSNKEQL